MFKRFVKAVKDAAKKVWEFIKSLLPKKPKPKEVEPELEEDIPPEEDPWEPEEEKPVEPEPVESKPIEPAIEDENGEEALPYELSGVVSSGESTGFIRIHNTGDTRVIQEYFHSVDDLLKCVSCRRNNDVMYNMRQSNKRIEDEDDSGFYLTSRVEDVIFDDDEGDITVVVFPDTHKNNGLNKAFSHVQKETMNRVKQLLNCREYQN